MREVCICLVAMVLATCCATATYARSDAVALAGEQSLRHPPPANDAIALNVQRWNRVAVDATGLDHTPAAPADRRVYGEQLGPGRSGRAMAIVHIAMFEVVNSAMGGFRSYIGLGRTTSYIHVAAAVSQAAHDTLVALFPSQTESIGERLRDDLRQFAEGGAKREAIALGRLAARLTLEMRDDDGANHPEPIVGIDYLVSQKPGEWRPDPISRLPVALGAHWSAVRPFVLQSPDQFRVPPPPALGSAEYAAAFDEVKLLGGDGVHTSTGRAEDETVAGVYWAYDGMPSLCAPPRLYNQIAVQIAREMGASGIELARLLALVNVALADAGTAVWESKYHFRFWRPVTAIRDADASGPSGVDDGNALTRGDPTFTPLGAPASNSAGPNFTPPFPAYPSGHAGFGGALFQVLRRFFGTDRIAFTFVSDEMNGKTRGSDGELRPLVPRRFLSLSEAEEENGQSRIYLGIHWAFDKTAGIRQGRQVGDAVFDAMFQPVP